MIEIKNVTKVYPNGVVGLKDVNLTINEGEFVSIIGLSGSGKSTLLRSLNRLNDISEGEILIKGKSLTKASKKELMEIRKSIGFIFQQFNLVKRMTVQKNCLSGRLGYYSTLQSILGLFQEEDYEKVNKALERVDLADKLHSRCDELSGGQQQRVSIARTIVQEAKIILADEPVASLDPVTSVRIMDDLKNLNTVFNNTVIVNIHSIELAREYSSRIIGLRAGQVVFDGTPEEATDAKLTEIYGDEIFKKSGEVKA